MTFDQEVKSECREMPGSYKPNLFSNTALAQSKVDWIVMIDFVFQLDRTGEKYYDLDLCLKHTQLIEDVKSIMCMQIVFESLPSHNYKIMFI